MQLSVDGWGCTRVYCREEGETEWHRTPFFSRGEFDAYLEDGRTSSIRGEDGKEYYYDREAVADWWSKSSRPVYRQEQVVAAALGHLWAQTVDAAALPLTVRSIAEVVRVTHGPEAWGITEPPLDGRHVSPGKRVEYFADGDMTIVRVTRPGGVVLRMEVYVDQVVVSVPEAAEPSWLQRFGLVYPGPLTLCARHLFCVRTLLGFTPPACAPDRTVWERLEQCFPQWWWQRKWRREHGEQEPPAVLTCLSEPQPNWHSEELDNPDYEKYFTPDPREAALMAEPLDDTDYVALFSPPTRAPWTDAE